MKKWILKAIVQKTISYLPFSHNINYIFQKYVRKGVYLSDEYFYDRLSHAKERIDAFATHSKKRIPDLEQVKLHDKYANNNKEGNAISHCHFISIMS